MHRSFEIIEHPADIGFVAHGATLEELFGNAALAMMSLAYELERVEEREQREIEANGADIESMLYGWLSEVLAISDAEHVVFCRFDVRHVGEGRASGTAYGETFDRTRHCANTYIKAVTYHQLEVKRSAEGWRAQVFLDV